MTSSHHHLCSCLTFTSLTSTTPMTPWTSGPPTGLSHVTRPLRWMTLSAITTTARWGMGRCSSLRESQRHPAFVSDWYKLLWSSVWVGLVDLDRHDHENIQDVVLGTGKVIDGLDLALRGMCVGEKRLVTVPPHLGHGENGGEATKTI